MTPQDIPDDAWELPIEAFRRKPEEEGADTLIDPGVGDQPFEVIVYRPDESKDQLVVYAPDLLPRQSENGWYIIPISPISPFALRERVPCDPEDYHLEQVPDSVAVLYQPPKSYDDLLTFTRLEELELQDLELLAQMVLIHRNLRAHQRQAAASTLGIQKRITEKDIGPWFYTTPDIRAEEEEIKKLEPKPDPEEGRQLELLKAAPGDFILLPVENGMAMQVPIWEAAEGRGKNWAAVITDKPREPGGLGRQWLPRPRKGEPGRCRVADLKPFQVVEWAADYMGPHGQVQTHWYGVVLRCDASEVLLRSMPTAGDAFTLAKALEQDAADGEI